MKDVSQKTKFLFMAVSFVCNARCSERPNIIFILADDLGWNDVSFHGSQQIPTPNIDALAHSGIILNNYYVQPICTPTRSALMTGRHPIHTGMQHDNIQAPVPEGLPLNETLMSQYLKKLGYRTHMIGKWHLGMYKNEYTPTYRGFESHFGYWLGAEDYFNHYSESSKRGYMGLDFRRNMEAVKNYSGQYSTELFTAEAVNIIDKHNKSEPLFLYLAFQAVHSGSFSDPLAAPQHYVDRFLHIKNVQRRIYAGMVSALDDAVGLVIKSLKEHGLVNNSIIVFSTDNGGPANGFNLNAASNFPLRGMKRTLWEGGIRGIGLIFSPLLEKTGYTSDNMLHVCDWLPTLYKAAGGSTSDLKDIDGFDMWNMLSENGTAVRKEILHNIDPVNNSSSIRVGDYKLLQGDVGMNYSDWYPPWQSQKEPFLSNIETENLSKISHWQHINPNEFRYKNSKLSIAHLAGAQVNSYSNLFGFSVSCGRKPYNASTNCNPVQSPCLFHIPSDPCEYDNIANQNPEIVKKLLYRIKIYSKNMVAPEHRKPDPRSNPKYHDGIWVPWMSRNETKKH